MIISSMNLNIKSFILLGLIFSNLTIYSQISVNNNNPYDSEIYLIDSILLGSGVVASNHQYQGDANQIGFFDGTMSNIGLDSGIIMSTGDINLIVPNGGGGGPINSPADDPDLLTVANSVPDLIGQNFTVSSVNDVAILEFDFVPVSSLLSFRYVFGSQEYFTYENTQYNDVFGFFIAGPGINGPYASPAGFPDGSVNIATIPDSDPELPITISSVNSFLNSEFFVDNSSLATVADADGFTTVMTAEIEVICGQTYHIRLAIADGSDTGLSSYVFLESGSFSSPALGVINSLNIDSTAIFTDCGQEITLTADIEGDFDFIWNTGETTSSIVVEPGLYWVEAEDSTGCQFNSDSLLVYSQPLPNLLLDSIGYYCENSSFLIDVGIESGTSPFEYEWNDNLGTSNSLNVDQEGTYVLSVVDSNGCTDTKEIQIFENSLPQLSFSPEEILVCGGNPVAVSAFGAETYVWSPDFGISSSTGANIDIFSLSSLNYNLEGTDTNGCVSSITVPVTAADAFDLEIGQTNVSCQGFQNGSISIFEQSGGITPITYSIDGGENYSTNNIFTDLIYGSYPVAVQNGIGCVMRDTIVIESAAPAMEIFTSSSDVLCNGDNSGVVSVDMITGGLPSSSGYSLNWFKSGTNTLVSNDSSFNAAAGGYYLVVQDANGCQSTEEVSVNEPAEISYTVDVNHITCFGDTDGSIDVVVTGGGVAPYSFNWTNLVNQTSSSLQNLSAGVYSLEITDANGCVTTIDVPVTAPAVALSSSASATSISCFGASTGSASVEVVGGTMPYNYLWSDGHVNAVAGELSSGTYTVTITDDRSCVITDTVEILENSEIVTTIIADDVSCFGGSDGSASATTVGGTSPLSYTWSTGSNNDSISNLSFGDYWLVTEDFSGCVVIDTIYVGESEKILIDVDVTNVLCNGESNGVLEVSVEGGTPAFSYEWYDTENELMSNNYMVTNLPASELLYKVVVYDAEECVDSVYARIREPEVLVLDSSSAIPAYCENIPTAELSVVASGGYLDRFSSYTFEWSTSDTGSILSNVNAGDYTVIVTDDNGCQDTLSLHIPLFETFDSEISSVPLNCYDVHTGTATVKVFGGFGPFNFNWNWSTGNSITENFVGSQDTTDFTIGSLPSGVVSVVVSDVNGCTITTQTDVEEPSELLYYVSKLSDQSCYGDSSSCDGEFVFLASGGSSDYTFTVSDVTSSSSFELPATVDSVYLSSLCSGFYEVELTDSHGCVGTSLGNSSVQPIEVNPGFQVTSTINSSYLNNIVCYGDTLASLTVENPNSSFIYNWYVDNHYIASGVSAMLPGGSVDLEATYLTCSSMSNNTIFVSQPSAVSSNADVVSTSCFGVSDGSINLSLSGGSPSYDISWSTDDTTSFISDLSSGFYSLTVTDAVDCAFTFDFEITSPSALEVESSVTDASCFGGADGTVELSVSGGVFPYDIDFDGEDPSFLSSGNYTATVTDDNNCVESIDYSIDSPSELSANFSVSSIPFVGSANGGVAPYNYDWLYFGNSQQSGSSTNFTPNKPGTYSLVVTDANGCESRLDLDYTVSSVSEYSDLSYVIYPNPTSGRFTVEVNGSSDSDHELKLIDTRGRVVLSRQFKKQIEINEKLNSGIYLLKITNQDSVFKQKIFINE